MKIIISAMTAIICLGLQARAEHLGDISCDASWKICLQSTVLDAADSLHYVTGVFVNGAGAPYLAVNDEPLLAIVNANQNVVVQRTNQADVVIGQVNDPIGEDANTAMSRALILAPGFTLNIVSEPGPQVVYCNQTAMGFIYEYDTHKTILHHVNIAQNGTALTSIEGQEIVEPPVSVHSSPTPCHNEQ